MYKLFYVGFSVLVIVSCSDPVKEQLTEVSRLEALRTKMAEIMAQQEASIKSETTKLENYIDRTETELKAKNAKIKEHKNAIAYCRKLVKTKTESNEWLHWNHIKNENLKLDKNYLNTHYGRLHRAKEPVSIAQCQRRLPVLEKDLAGFLTDVELLTSDVQQKRDASVKQFAKMIRDLETSKTALDSLNALHTEAVFVLSKMNN